MPLKMALVGCGAMGSALLQGWLTLPNSLEKFEKFWVIAPHREKVEPFLKDNRVEWLFSPDELPELPDAIVFAVKPYLLEEILPLYTSYGSLFISITAGKSLSFYRERLGPSCSLLRAMPNIPVKIHQGIIGLLATSLSEKEKVIASTCFQGLGLCLWVHSDEDLDKLTALSGSGPAYVFAFMDAFAECAESLGFDPKTSQDLALHTFLGASTYAYQSQESFSTLCERITSPRGTTAEALKVLEKGGMSKLMDTAIKAAYNKAREIAKNETQTL